MKASIDSIETLGSVDGPGIRAVVFFNGCKLRCKYCHNPETWQIKDMNYTSEELFNQLIKFKPYFKENGGITFSGGEPLLQNKFLLEICMMLKKENINIALDTAGVGNGNYEEILKYIDLVILDIKGINNDSYKEMVNYDMDEVFKFINVCNFMSKKMWLRHVIIPSINDSKEYILNLVEYAKTFKNVEKIELLPYHLFGIEKYKKMGIPYLLEGIPALSIKRLNELSILLKEKV